MCGPLPSNSPRKDGGAGLPVRGRVATRWGVAAADSELRPPSVPLRGRSTGGGAGAGMAAQDQGRRVEESLLAQVAAGEPPALPTAAGAAFSSSPPENPNPASSSPDAIAMACNRFVR